MALFTDMEQTPGSGCGYIFKGDLNNADWLIECKSTRDRKLKLDVRWVDKTKKDAKRKQKMNYAVLFGWEVRPQDYNGELHFAIFPAEFDELNHVPLVLKNKTNTLTPEIIETIKEKGCFVFAGERPLGYLTTLSTFIDTCLNQSS